MKKSEATRLAILQKSFELIYAKGYQNTSIDDILATTQVTKGAFYYHFKNKDEMGLAIIHELMQPALMGGFKETLLASCNPLEGIYNLMHRMLIEDKFLKVEYGCPAANFTQEMAPWHHEFGEALQEISKAWTKELVAALERGKKEGYLRNDANTKQIALFVMSGYWGIRNFGKLANSKKVYLPYLKELKTYLEGLQ